MSSQPTPERPTPPLRASADHALAEPSGTEPADPGPAARPTRRGQRKQMLLRLDPQVYEALARWAGDELRSANAQVEFLLRRALREAGRLPQSVAPIPRRGRPPRDPAPARGAAETDDARGGADASDASDAPDSSDAPRTRGSSAPGSSESK